MDPLTLMKVRDFVYVKQIPQDDGCFISHCVNMPPESFRSLLSSIQISGELLDYTLFYDPDIVG